MPSTHPVETFRKLCAASTVPDVQRLGALPADQPVMASCERAFEIYEARGTTAPPNQRFTVIACSASWETWRIW